METIGYLAGALTLIGFVPQTIKTLNSRKTDELSLSTFLIISTSAVLWTIYGLSNDLPAIWITNGVVAACCLTIVVIEVGSSK